LPVNEMLPSVTGYRYATGSRIRRLAQLCMARTLHLARSPNQEHSPKNGLALAIPSRQWRHLTARKHAPDLLFRRMPKSFRPPVSNWIDRFVFADEFLGCGSLGIH
jgi:hypothetical protein